MCVRITPTCTLAENSSPPSSHTCQTAGQMLRVLPPVLYGMTFVNLWVKLQLPHSALLHWAASSAFTLGLQVGGGLPQLCSACAVCVEPAREVCAAQGGCCCTTHRALLHCAPRTAHCCTAALRTTRCAPRTAAAPRTRTAAAPRTAHCCCTLHRALLHHAPRTSAAAVLGSSAIIHPCPGPAGHFCCNANPPWSQPQSCKH